MKEIYNPQNCFSGLTVPQFTGKTEATKMRACL